MSEELVVYKTGIQNNKYEIFFRGPDGKETSLGFYTKEQIENLLE